MIIYVDYDDDDDNNNNTFSPIISQYFSLVVKVYDLLYVAMEILQHQNTTLGIEEN
jgi:hypothetical protein